MGLLDSIAGAFLKVSEVVAKAVVAIPNALGANIQVEKAEVAAKEPIGKAIGLAGAAATAALGVAALGSGSLAAGGSKVVQAASKAATSLVPTTIKGKVIAAVAAPVVISAVSSSPKLQQAILNAPSTLAKAGSDIGALAENPTAQGALDLAKEHPGLVAAAAGVAIAAVGGGILGTISNIQNTEAVKENTKATALAQPVTQTISQLPSNNLVASPTTTIAAPKKKAAKKKKKKKAAKKKSKKKKKKTTKKNKKRKSVKRK